MAPNFPVTQADFLYDKEWTEQEDRLFVSVLLEQQSLNNLRPNAVNAHAVLMAMNDVNTEFNKSFTYEYCCERLELLEKSYRTFYWVIRKHGVMYDSVNNKVTAARWVFEEIYEENQFGLAYQEFGDPCWTELCQLFGSIYNHANSEVIDILSSIDTDDIGNMSGLPKPPTEVINILSSSWSSRDESFWRYLAQFFGGGSSESEMSVNQDTPTKNESNYLQWGQPWPSPTHWPRQPRAPHPFIPSPSKSADNSGSSCKPTE